MSTITPKPSLQDLLNQFTDLPVNPDLLPKLKILLSNEHSLLIDIATLLRVDPSITSKLLKISNSAFFSPKDPVNSVEEAISRLGFKEVYQLVNLEITRRILTQHPLAYDTSAKDLWLHSIHSALLMESLARKFSTTKDAAYTTGLLANIGKTFLSKFFPQLSKGTPHENAHLTPKSEIELFGFSFATAGAALLEKWNFPQEITLPIQFQLNPLDADPQLPTAHMLHLSQSIAPKLHIDDPSNEDNLKPELLFLQQIKKPKQDLISSVKAARKKLDDLTDIFLAFS